MKQPEDVQLSREDGEALIERIEQNTLSAEDRRVLVKVLTFYFWLLFALREAKLSLKRLKALVFGESSLGKAIAYLLGHWETLTRFVTAPGAPLDNNIAERALKLGIRQRKNSLFYATEHSAYIASLLTSVIATCLQAGVNALAYLVAVPENRQAGFSNPNAGLPWTYLAALVPA